MPRIIDPRNIPSIPLNPEIPIRVTVRSTLRPDKRIYQYADNRPDSYEYEPPSYRDAVISRPILRKEKLR